MHLYSYASIPIAPIVFWTSVGVLPVRTNMIHSLLWGLYSGACLSIIVWCILVWSSSWHFVWPPVAWHFLRASLHSCAKTLSVYSNNCVGIAGIGFARYGWGGARHIAMLYRYFYQALVAWIPWVHSPLYRWLLLSLLGSLVGHSPPGAPFSGFGDLNSPGTFPLIQMATFEPLRSSCGEDPSERLRSIMLRPEYKQSVHHSIKYKVIFISTLLSPACEC